MKRVLLVFLFIAFGVLAAAFPCASVVSAKSYEVIQVSITAQLHPDGTMQVEENRTFNFDGSYSFAYQAIKKNPDQSKSPGRVIPYILSNFQVCDQEKCYQQTTPAADNQLIPARVGSFYVRDEADQYYIKWFYNVANTDKIFTLKYTVNNAVTLHRDIAELYWQWIGDQWEVPQKNITVNLQLPPGIPGSDIQAWAHGPSEGIVSILSTQQVSFRLPYLSSGDFFEGRVIFPKNIFTSGAVGSSTKEVIQRQENQFIQETQNKLNTQRKIAFIFGGFNFIFTLGMVIFFGKTVIDFWRGHKEKPLPKINQSNTLWEPPSDLSPAQVEQLLHARKTLTPKSFTATVLNLVHLRYFTFVRSDKKYGFLFPDWKYYLVRVDNQPVEKLTGVDLRVYQFLIDDVGEQRIKQSDGQMFVAIPLDQIVQHCKDHPTSSNLFFKVLEDVAFRANLIGGYFDRSAHSSRFAAPAITAAVVGGCFAFVTLFAIHTSDSPFARLMAAQNIVITGLVFTGVMIMLDHRERRTDQGALETAGWKAFQKHLTDYKTTGNYAIDSVVLWEKYLVYGTLLGVSAKTLSQLPVNFSAADQTIATGHWAGFSNGSGGGFGQSFHSFSSALNSL